MFYLTTHSTHYFYGYMASDIWLRTILIVRKETRCRHIGYSYRLTARVLLYAPSHRQDNTYHGLCYTSRGALAGTRKITKEHTHKKKQKKQHKNNNKQTNNKEQLQQKPNNFHRVKCFELPWLIVYWQLRQSSVFNTPRWLNILYEGVSIMSTKKLKIQEAGVAYFQ